MADSAVTKAFDWLCRNPESGRVVIAQPPNAPLLLFIGASLVRRFVARDGLPAAAAGAGATAALLWWGIDEVWRGDSRFRRLLGGGVTAATLVRLVLGVS